MIFIMEHLYSKNCLDFLTSSFSSLLSGVFSTVSLWLAGTFLSCSSWKGISGVVLLQGGAESCPVRAGKRLAPQGRDCHNAGSEGTIVSPSWAERAGKAPRFRFRIISSTSRPLKAARCPGCASGAWAEVGAGSSGEICCFGKALSGLPLRKGSSSVPSGSFLCYIGSMNHFPDPSCAVFKVESSKKISLKYTQSYFLLDVWALI